MSTLVTIPATFVTDPWASLSRVLGTLGASLHGCAAQGLPEVVPLLVQLQIQEEGEALPDEDRFQVYFGFGSMGNVCCSKFSSCL